MSGPARSGVLIYAKDLARLSAFYEAVLDDVRVVHADDAYRVLASSDAQLVLHAIPPEVAATIPLTDAMT